MKNYDVDRESCAALLAVSRGDWPGWLSCAFDWGKTPQGKTYWGEIDDGLRLPTQEDVDFLKSLIGEKEESMAETEKLYIVTICQAMTKKEAMDEVEYMLNVEGEDLENVHIYEVAKTLKLKVEMVEDV